ncbi:MAG: hypothetical protein R3C42_03355 [Parvularculaceae bacterium]
MRIAVFEKGRTARFVARLTSVSNLGVIQTSDMAFGDQGARVFSLTSAAACGGER